MKITKIVAQVKTKGRYSIYVDDAFAFGISELGLMEAGYRIGQEFTKNELASFKEAAQIDKIYNMTLGLLARRPRSKWEIYDYLKRKEIDAESAESIVKRLEKKGYVDDYDFARRWVENRRLLKPISKRKLQLELRTKRVSDAVAKTVLDEDDTDEFDVLVREVEKKRRQSRYQDNQKLMQYLARQGYGYDDIKRALANDAS